jgi:hypothetical protein
MHTKCAAKNHDLRWRCAKGPPAECQKCRDDQRRAEKKKKEEFEHAEKIAQLEAERAKMDEALRDRRAADERKNAILQREKDLEDACVRVSQYQSRPTIPPQSPSPNQSPLQPGVTGMHEYQLPGNRQSSSQSSTDNAKSNPAPPSLTSPQGFSQAASVNSNIYPPTPSTAMCAVPTNPSSSPLRSPARDEWERRKRVDGDSNDAIDKIMQMTGLENVKEQVLKIKDKIVVSMRQQSDIKSERFNVSMLGNPGTGMRSICSL